MRKLCLSRTGWICYRKTETRWEEWSSLFTFLSDKNRKRKTQSHTIFFPFVMRSINGQTVESIKLLSNSYLLRFFPLVRVTIRGCIMQANLIACNMEIVSNVLLTITVHSLPSRACQFNDESFNLFDV